MKTLTFCNNIETKVCWILINTDIPNQITSCPLLMIHMLKPHLCWRNFLWWLNANLWVPLSWWENCHLIQKLIKSCNQVFTVSGLISYTTEELERQLNKSFMCHAFTRLPQANSNNIIIEIVTDFARVSGKHSNPGNDQLFPPPRSPHLIPLPSLSTAFYIVDCL